MIYTFHIILTPYISSPLPTPVNVWRFESFSHKNLYNITRVNIWKSFRKQSFISGKQWMKAWSRWRWNGFSIFLKTEWVQCSTYVLSVMLYFSLFLYVLLEISITGVVKTQKLLPQLLKTKRRLKHHKKGGPRLTIEEFLM